MPATYNSYNNKPRACGECYTAASACGAAGATVDHYLMAGSYPEIQRLNRVALQGPPPYHMIMMPNSMKVRARVRTEESANMVYAAAAVPVSQVQIMEPVYAAAAPACSSQAPVVYAAATPVKTSQAPTVTYATTVPNGMTTVKRSKIPLSRSTAIDPMGDACHLLEPALLTRDTRSAINMSRCLSDYSHIYVPQGAQSSMLEILETRDRTALVKPLDLPATRLVRFPANTQAYPMNLQRPLMRERVKVLSGNIVHAPDAFALQENDMVFGISENFVTEGVVLPGGVSVRLEATPPAETVDIFVTARA